MARKRGGMSLTTPSGRPAAFGQRVRDRIETTKIVKRLQATAIGEEDMTQTQIQAARILLDRTVPVLKPIEFDVGDGGEAKTISDRQLLEVIEGSARLVKVE